MFFRTRPLRLRAPGGRNGRGVLALERADDLFFSDRSAVAAPARRYSGREHAGGRDRQLWRLAFPADRAQDGPIVKAKLAEVTTSRHGR
jgi:hypothetical protein